MIQLKHALTGVEFSLTTAPVRRCPTGRRTSEAGEFSLLHLQPEINQ